MKDPITYLHECAIKLDVSDIAGEVLNDIRFSLWSASSHYKKHHYGEGGLAQHTAEVAELCLNNLTSFSLYYPETSNNLLPSRDVVFLAALFHDAGKMNDYQEITPGNWAPIPHKRLVHHISSSAIIWSRAVDKHPLYRGIEQEVLHAILAHHGSREYGSPVAPKTRLAWMLHLCDMLSARMNDADTLDVVEHY